MKDIYTQISLNDSILELTRDEQTQLAKWLLRDVLEGNNVLVDELEHIKQFEDKPSTENAFEIVIESLNQ